MTPRGAEAASPASGGDDEGRGLVDLDVWAEDQRGETTATGVAAVELPTR